MLKKRLVVLVALAIISVIPPVVYQYIVEPRSEGANVTLEIQGISYNKEDSDDEQTAFKVFLSLTNDEENDVIVSPLDLDVYYRSPDSDRYLLIGKLTTDRDYTVPGDSYVASDENGRTDPNQDDYDRNAEIVGILYFFKDPAPMKEGANEALVDLINKQSIDLVMKGEAKFGPISIPFEAPDVTLALDIWDPELIIYDVFLMRTPAKKVDTFIIHTLMRNPSGLPLNLEEFDLSLYNETGAQVGWPINSIDIATSIDPDETSKELAEIYLDNDISYRFEEGEKYTWRDVFLGFNFTDPNDPTNKDNTAWLVRKLMDEDIIKNVKLKGPATIILGNKDKGFKIDMTEEEDYLELSNVNFYQKFINKYEGKSANYGTPIKMFSNFTVDQLTVNKMIVNTKTEQVRMDISAGMTLNNPYRFAYQITDFSMSYRHNTGGEFARSVFPTDADVEAAVRDYNVTSHTWLKTIIPSITTIPVNLTTTFDTGNQNAGIYKIIEDLGGDPKLLNLTNPFYIDPASPEYEQCPMNTIEYLIGQNVNPLTFLNEVSLLAQVKTYQPLRGQYFDNTSRTVSQAYQQALSDTDMPYARGSNFPLYSHLSHCQVPTIDDWDNYYDDGSFENGLRRNNLYEIVRHSFLDNYFLDDEDGGAASYNIAGAIFKAPTGSSDRVTSGGNLVENTPHSDLIWRVYQDVGGGGNWGFDYSYNDYGEKGYIIGMYLPSGDSAMLAQNFTLNPALFPNGAEDIEEVTLSISYQYVSKTFPNDNAYLLFSWLTPGTSLYPYTQFGTTNAFHGRNGYPLKNSKDGGWNHYSVDLTQAFKTRIAAYYSSGLNRDYLKGEVSFSGWPAGGSILAMHFDDIVLNIKYKDSISSSTGALNLEDVFAYLEHVNPTQGNMFNLFAQLADEGSMDATTFWTYIDGDLRNGPSQGMDFFKYLSYTNTSLSAMTNILQNEYTDLDIPEPANFLDMLNNPRYEIHNDFDYGYTGPVVSTKYGPRVETKGYWTIEDPYNASREIVQTLYRNIFRDQYGAISDNQMDEMELWYLLENLGVSPHWLVLYLLTHGWTKDDVFDALEALGLGCEINYDYPVTWGIPGSSNPNPSFWGRLTAFLDVTFQVYGITLVSLNDEPFAFDMGQIMTPGAYQMFSALSAYSSGNGRALVNNYGTITNPVPVYKSGSFDVWFIPVSWSSTITPQAFSIEMYVRPTASDLIVQPTDWTNFPTDYVSTTYPYGFMDAGTQMHASNMRINYKFAGGTFITSGGDPISMFQFLDNYWFAKRDGVDYNSFTLLNYFDVSSLDFVDIITGYNNVTKDWDHNGNGRADDWTAPLYYGDADLDGQGYAIDNPTSTLSGWGTNFRDCRLFYSSSQYPSLGQSNGKIIWRDSPDFARDNPTHRAGNVVVAAAPSGDDLTEGAPPIVNLLDMLAWISEFSGKPDPDQLMKWLLGELGNDKYQIIDPFTGRLADSLSNNGLNNQKVWRMLSKSSLNSTGFFNWLEKEKNINSFKFLFMLNQSIGIINPIDLLFFATRANLINFDDGSLAWYYHEALGPTDSNNLLWNFFNLASFDERAFFLLLNSTGFNIFDMFVYLRVDPASWINKLNTDHNIEPIELIKRMKKLVPGLQYIELDKGASTIVDIKANLTVSYEGILLKNFTNLNIADNKVLTTKDHFSNFIDSATLTGNNFQFINS